MANFKIIKAVINEKQQVAENTFQLRMVDPDGAVFEFQPGQFATITVAPMTKRSYSIASIPGKNYIDFIADTNRGGPGSQFFANAKEGDVVEMIIPLGNFYYIESDKPAYFFGTGTGVVPFMSMVEHALTTLKTTRKLYLYSGFRFVETVFGKELLELLDVQYENFSYKLNLTQPPQDWMGPVGRITQYIDQLKETDIECYVCGSNDMVTDVVERLKAKGVPDAQIHHEMFY